MYDKKNIEKMATETPKRSLDNQEFIAWKEDVMPSSSTQLPRKVIKLELVAMKTHAGDFEHIWVHTGEKPFALKVMKKMLLLLQNMLKMKILWMCKTFWSPFIWQELLPKMGDGNVHFVHMRPSKNIM